MKVSKTELDGLFLVSPQVFEDERGYFFESFNLRSFIEQSGEEVSFVQDNESMSSRGILRGLHFQALPHAQGKLIRVTQGSVLDVCVDLRQDKGTFGQHFKLKLNSTEKNMLYVPPGFAHGFVSLEDDTIFEYKCTGYYNKASERTLLWNDPDLGIDWGIEDPILSAKDEQGIPLSKMTPADLFAGVTNVDE